MYAHLNSSKLRDRGIKATIQRGCFILYLFSPVGPDYIAYNATFNSAQTNFFLLFTNSLTILRFPSQQNVDLYRVKSKYFEICQRSCGEYVRLNRIQKCAKTKLYVRKICLCAWEYVYNTSSKVRGNWSKMCSSSDIQKNYFVDAHWRFCCSFIYIEHKN